MVLRSTVIAHCTHSRSAALLQDRLELFTGNVPQFGDLFAVHFDRGEFQAEKPLNDGRVGLLYYLDVERVLFLEFCDHRTDILSSPAGWVVKI